MSALDVELPTSARGPEWLSKRRALAARRFETVSLPDGTDDLWRYSGVERLALGRAVALGAPGLPLVGEWADWARSEALAQATAGRRAVLGSLEPDLEVVTLGGWPVAAHRRVAAHSRAAGLELFLPDALDDAPSVLGAVVPREDAFFDLHEACSPGPVVLVARADGAAASASSRGREAPKEPRRVSGRSSLLDAEQRGASGAPAPLCVVVHVLPGSPRAEVQGGAPRPEAHGAALAPVGAAGGEGEVVLVAPRLLVVLEAGAACTLVELAVGLGAWSNEALAGFDAGDGVGARASVQEGDGGPRWERPGSLALPVTELLVGEGAELAYGRVQLLPTDAWELATVAARLGANARLASHLVAFGGSYARTRVVTRAEGAESSTALSAASLAAGEQVHDARVLQDHEGPRSRSDLLFVGALAERARSVYWGLVRVAKGAKGVDAFQTNRNLVLSEGAHADSVPNLDIEEHDVRCSHASAVGPIDELQRFALESKGVHPATAERLIATGFFEQVAERAPLCELAGFVRKGVAVRLGHVLNGAAEETEPYDVEVEGVRGG